MAARRLDVQVRSHYRPLPLRAVIRRALRAAADHEGLPDGSSVGVLVCDDDTIRDFNRRFAGEDHATDVLSFPAGGDGELGDIILSLDHLRSQAEAAGHSLDVEAATLAVHGFLHLLGFDHAGKREELVMFGKTAEIVDGLGLPG
ncbi:MAG TPA: rRNA maturation RNase YbeY [Candidatus Solibacter sp.]|nr:rRNA maturation RNase YbeY [Candidatus Solibacter sp.]